MVKAAFTPVIDPEKTFSWKISPVFNISQKQRDILDLIQSHLRCGSIGPRKDGVWVYQGDNRKALHHHILPFFNRHSFWSKKKKADFARFQDIISLLEPHASTTLEDLQEILHLLDHMDSERYRT